MAPLARQRRLEVVIAGDASGAQNAFRAVAQSGDTFGSKVGAAAGIAARGIGIAAIAAGGLAVGMGVLGKKALDVASDMNEFRSRVEVVFGSSSDEVLAFAETTTKAFGISQRDALDYLGSLGAMAQGLGFNQQEAAGMSQQIVQLAGDWASFANANPEEVLEAMQSAFRGEYDALQRYIPSVKAATVEQKAMAMTGKTVAKTLTDQEKAAALMTIMVESSSLAMGDAARTADSWANVQRRLSAHWQDFLGVIGQIALPVMGKLGATFEKFISSIMPQFTATFQRLGEHVFPALADAITQKVEPTLMRLGEVLEESALIFSEYADNIGQAIRAGDWDGVKNMIRDALNQSADAALREFFPSWHMIAEGGDWEELKRKLADRLVDTLTTAIGYLAARAGQIGAALGFAIGAGLLSTDFTEGVASGLIAGLTGADIENAAVQAGGEVGGWFLKGMILIALIPGLSAGGVVSKALGPLITRLGAAIAGSAFVVASGGSIGAAIVNAIVLGAAGLLGGIGAIIGGIVAVITSPITLIVAAIAGIIAIGYVVYRNWETIKNFAIEAWGAIASFFTDTVGPAIATFFTETLPNAGRAVLDFFTGLPSLIGNALYAFITDILPTFAGNFLQFWTETIPRWQEQFGEWARGMLERFGEWLGQLPGRIATWLGQAWTNVTTWAGQMIERFGTAASEALARFTEWFGQLPGRVADWLGRAWNSVVEFARNLPSNVAQGARDAFNAVAEWLGRLPEAVRGWLADVIRQIGSWGSELAGAVRRAAQEAWRNFRDAFTGSPETKIELLIEEMAENTRSHVDTMLAELRRLEGAGNINFGAAGGLLGSVMGIARGAMSTAVAAGGRGGDVHLHGIFASSEQQLLAVVQRAQREYARRNGNSGL